MSFSEIPPPPEVTPGQDEPFLRVRPPGPQSRSWLTRAAHVAAPMGPPLVTEQHAGVRSQLPAGSIVYSTAKGSNVIDVDGNRYVDLAAGFGALLIGHCHPHILRVIELQSARLMQALGDVHPAEAKIALMTRLAALYPGEARVILGQSGADAVSAALKTALLATGKPGVIAFEASYHGLSYAPLAASGLRASYRKPFAAQLNPHVCFVPYPRDVSDAELVLERVRFELVQSNVGAVLIEPLLGRGGCVVPPADFLPELGQLARAAGALTIADEIWTGLGRAGKLLFSLSDGFVPDLVCLGKGLGGGLPVSACLGRAELMKFWQREEEVVETSTFAGAPLACATAIATLDLLEQKKLPERAAEVGERWLARMRIELEGVSEVSELRGAGLMLGIDLGKRPRSASLLQRALLERGYIVSTGGGAREVLVLTPALDIDESLLHGFCDVLRRVLLTGAAA